MNINKRIILMLFALTGFGAVMAQPLIRTSADTLNFETPRYTSTTRLLTIFNDGDQPLSLSITDVVPSSALRSAGETRHIDAQQSSDVIEQLAKIRFDAADVQRPDYSEVSASPNAVLISDSTNDSNFPGLDLVTVEFSEDVFSYIFKLTYSGTPDTNSVAVISVDSDQNMATGSFPAPLGFGPVFFDIGSEYEIIFDIGGILSDTLGIPPAAIIIAGGDTTLTPIGVTILAFSGNTVTGTFLKFLTPNLDLDDDMNAGAITLPVGTLGIPDFAPNYGHGRVGSELGVSWLAQSDTAGNSATPFAAQIAVGGSLDIAIKLAAVEPEGSYPAQLNINNNSSNQPNLAVPVNVAIGGIAAPVISVVPEIISDTLQLNDPPKTVILGVLNTGSGSLTCFIGDSLGEGENWLSVADLPIFQVESGELHEVLISLSPEGLNIGTTYSGVLFINSNDLDNPRVAVPVQLTIEPPTAIPGESSLPGEFALHSSYPNPFNPETRIVFDVAEPATVELAIFNLLGQKVRTLFNGFRSAGQFSQVWDGKNDAGNLVGSGVYLVRYSTPKGSFSQKIMLAR